MKLFDDIERTFLGPSSNNETPYNYYNRSARKDVETIRETLENWFLKIPEKDKKEMKASFKNLLMILSMNYFYFPYLML